MDKTLPTLMHTYHFRKLRHCQISHAAEFEKGQEKEVMGTCLISAMPAHRCCFLQGRFGDLYNGCKLLSEQSRLQCPYTLT